VLPKTHSRQPRGECGQRLGDRIDGIVQYIRGPVITPEDEWPDDEPLELDGLLQQIRHEATCQSACCGSPEPISTAVDPPVEVVISTGACDEGKGARSSAAGGSGFSNDAAELIGTAWQVVAGEHAGSGIEELDHLEAVLDESPRLAGPMMLSTIVRLREALNQIPKDASTTHPVMITAMDAVLLSRSVLKGLR